MVKIEHLNKFYGEKQALNDLNLEIKQGSIFGLLGVNGAGKTTLLSILNGLLDFESGNITIDNMDMKHHLKDIKAISSIIPQNLAFYEKLTVKENLAFFASMQNAKKENIEMAIEVNKLSSLINQKAYTLSGGQKRRLNIAIGLLNDPKIIYFDEPTVGIDPKSRNEILDSIKSYKNLGITVVYTSHYMAEIERICDDVAIINDGKLVEHNSLENLLSNKKSDTVYIEVVYTDRLQELNLELSDLNTICTTEKELFSILKVLEKNEIFVKQIRYGSTNLEKLFLDITGEQSA